MLQGQSYFDLFRNLVNCLQNLFKHIPADRSRHLHFVSKQCIHDFFIVFLVFKSPDAQLMPSDLEAWEKKHGMIPDDVILLVFTNWGRYWPDKKKYLGTDTADISLLHFPGKEISTG